jgi:large subunit ribosomal protein L13
MKTFYPTPKDQADKQWFVVDAEGKNLGRLAVRVASILRGKHKPTYSMSVDMGDFVVIVNADKIAVTGNKLEDKKYYRHSGYVGSIKETNLEKLMETKPTEAIARAIKGMLPKNRIGRAMLGKLKVYAGAEHPHAAQAPQALPEHLVEKQIQGGTN